MTTAYPLSWPLGVPRTEPTRRQSSSFKTALNSALGNVTNSLRRFGEATGKKVEINAARDAAMAQVAA